MFWDLERSVEAKDERGRGVPVDEVVRKLQGPLLRDGDIRNGEEGHKGCPGDVAGVNMGSSGNPPLRITATSTRDRNLVIKSRVFEGKND